MKTMSISAILCLLGSGIGVAESQTPTEIFRSGKPLLPVVVHESASETTVAAANELAIYLGRMTHTTFKVRRGAAERGIFVGTLAEFPVARFNQALRIKDGHDGVESFAISPDGNSVYLIGATKFGASHAVFRFLERLGCRWYFPAAEWEVVPRHERIVVDFEESDRPRIPARRIWWGYGFFDRREGRCQADYEAWARHNRMAESFRTYTGHAWQSIIGDNQATFDSHPEYLALVDGKRRGPQMCISNPAVRGIATEWALKRLKKRPDLDMVSMETSDGSFHCECEKCQRLGSISERAFGLANDVAKVVAREHPGKMVGMLAYNDHCEPPSFALEPNVYVQSTAGFVRGRYTFDELLKLWPKKTRNIGFYEYFSVWLWDKDQLPGGRANHIEEVARRIRNYAEAGATSITCESGNNWGLHGRGYYIANRLMWNPDENVDELLADFYENAFGPAAKTVRRFYERFDVGAKPLMSEHLLALAFRDLQEATQLVGGRTDVPGRLDHLKQYLHYVRVRWDLDHLPRDQVEKRKALALDGLTWCYRTRYSYMNHWAGMWQTWTRQAATEFDEPSWSFKSQESYPWEVDNPVNHEETERVFHADLERFQPQDVNEVEFSENLVRANVPNEFPAKVRPRPLFHRYQRPMRYVAVSETGEPIRFRITTGIIKHYRDRAEGRWSVSTAAGTEVAAGKLRQDGETHSIEVQVPDPGAYNIIFNDQGAGWGIEADDDVAISLAIERGRRIIHLGQFRDPVFFFVPTGTKQLQLFWEGGNLKPRVHRPDGEIVTEIEANGSYVNIPIPDGMDGKAWHFTRFAPKRIWFANAPNYLAASPEALVLPEESIQD